MNESDLMVWVDPAPPGLPAGDCAVKVRANQPMQGLDQEAISEVVDRVAESVRVALELRPPTNP